MKRFIAAVSFAVLAVPAFAETGLPYEQTLVDRALPDVAERKVDSQASRRTVAAFPGDTRSDVEIAADATREIAPDAPEQSVWARDHNFIAPAQ